MARKLAVAALGLLALWAVLCALAYAAMLQPPEEFGRTMARVPGPMAMALPFQTLWLT